MSVHQPHFTAASLERTEEGLERWRAYARSTRWKGLVRHLTGPGWERYHAPQCRSSFCVQCVADIVGQIFRVACTEDLHQSRPEDYDAAACDYQAEYGLSDSAVLLEMRQYGTLTEIDECVQVIAPMQIYAKRWRRATPRAACDVAARHAAKMRRTRRPAL